MIDGQHGKENALWKGGPGMPDAKRNLIEKFIGHYNAKDVGAMMDLCTDDVVFESISNTDGVTRTVGREELRRLALMGAEFFEKRRQTPTNWVLGESNAAVEIGSAT